MSGAATTEPGAAVLPPKPDPGTAAAAPAAGSAGPHGPAPPDALAGGPRVRRWRGPAAVAAALLAAALSGLALLGRSGGEPLDPRGAQPQGARALANVLREHGVDVRPRDRFADVARDVRDRPAATVLVARPELLAVGRAADLRRLLRESRSDLVLVGAQPDVLAGLGLPVRATSGAPGAVRRPACSDPTAGRAGDALTGGTGYQLTDAGEGRAEATAVEALVGAVACYPGPGGATVLVLHHRDGRTTTLLGTGRTLTNDRIADAGDAALAVGVLGPRQRLVWWTPRVTDGASSTRQPSPLALVPDGVRFALLQLLVAVVVVALWRGRRLGRLAVEPLPVVVRAVEATQGRARLYRRARARGRAARVLRAAAARRIAVRCGLPRTADPGEVAAVVAERTGRRPADVHALLAGAEPADDASLVGLARDLDSLEREVR